MSLFYGYKKSTDTTGGLPLSGGTMTGDIDMGTNYITTSSDPTQNSHLARKKYVDDLAFGGRNFLSTSGGTMQGDINMGDYKIFSTVDPTDDRHLTRKKYVDTEDNKKVSKSGDTMSGDLTMGSNKIISNSDPTQDTHLARKKYVDNNFNILKKDIGFSLLKDNFSLKFHNLFFVEYDSSYDLLFERNGGKVKELVDYGVEGKNLKQTTTSLQPSLNLENEKENNKYFLKFNNNRMTTDSNINPISGKKDIMFLLFIN